MVGISIQNSKKIFTSTNNKFWHFTF